MRAPYRGATEVTTLSSATSNAPARPESYIPSRLRPVLEAVRRAPSGHNTQPWRLTLEDESRFHIGWAAGRWLSVADPTREVMALSLGCAIEAAGAVADIEFLPASGDPLGEGGHAGELRVAKINDSDNGLRLLSARSTDRAHYVRAEIPAASLRELARVAQAHGAALSVVTELRGIRQLAELTARAAREKLGDAEYLRELLDWIRLSESEPDWDLDGFTPATLLLDRPTVSLVSWLKRSPRARWAFSKLGISRLMAAQVAAAVKHSGALLLLSSPDASPQGLIAAGRALMAVWLAVTRADLALQPVHFALGNPECRREVQRLFGVPTGSHPASLIRLGRSGGSPPKSERLPLHRICEVRPGEWE